MVPPHGVSFSIPTPIIMPRNQYSFMLKLCCTLPIYTPSKEKGMTQVVTSERKQVAVRGFQMLVIGIMMNMGLAIIGFLAFLQFLWMLVANEKNAFISDLGSSFRFWYDKAIAFLLGASEKKPFPWQKV